MTRASVRLHWMGRQPHQSRSSSACGYGLTKLPFLLAIHIPGCWLYYISQNQPVSPGKQQQRPSLNLLARIWVLKRLQPLRRSAYHSGFFFFPLGAEKCQHCHKEAIAWGSFFFHKMCMSEGAGGGAGGGRGHWYPNLSELQLAIENYV